MPGQIEMQLAVAVSRQNQLSEGAREADAAVLHALKSLADAELRQKSDAESALIEEKQADPKLQKVVKLLAEELRLAKAHQEIAHGALARQRLTVTTLKEEIQAGHRTAVLNKVQAKSTLLVGQMDKLAETIIEMDQSREGELFFAPQMFPTGEAESVIDARCAVYNTFLRFLRVRALFDGALARKLGWQTGEAA